MSSVVLNNGYRMPIIGLGTFLSDDEKELSEAMHAAFGCGYRHFDTAFVYKNEHIIGNCFHKWINSGMVKREELFVTTKLPICAMKATKVKRFFEKSLEALRLDYVDLYLIHVPFGLDSKGDDDVIPIKNGLVAIDKNCHLEAVWAAMEDLVRQGRVKSIGLSNCDATQVQRIIDCAKIKPAVLQVEVNVYFQQPKLSAVCQKHNIRLCAYAPLGSPGRQKFYSPLGMTFQATNMLTTYNIKRIAQKYKKSSAQICLRFLVQQEITVIPKSVNSGRILENMQIFDFNLEPWEMNFLKSLDKGQEGRSFKFNFLPGIEVHPEFPEDMKNI